MDKVNNTTDRLTNNHLKQLVIKTCQQLWLMIIMAVISTTAAATTTISYYHNDHLGTPQVLTDENQNIVWQAEYDPFGKANITTETATNNVRFPGQYFDQETNLHYNYFRTYDPSTGRYITSDPVGLEGGINTFGYVRGNPLGYSDFYGLFQVRASQSIGTGEWVTSYDITYNPLSKNVSIESLKIISKIMKSADRLGSFANFIQPKKVGPNNPFDLKEFLQCGLLDKELEDTYGGKRDLTRKEADKLLEDMFNNYPEMKKLYPKPQRMLDKAESNSINHWFYKKANELRDFMGL